MKLLAPIINDDDIVNKKYVDTATNKLQAQVDDKADKSHNHDDRYYTESEVDSKVSAINNTISSHISDTSNPHSVTKSQVGLSNVENKSSATIRGELTKSNVTTALGYTPYTPSEVDNKFAALETNIDWKEAVSTFADIATTYPNPEDGWTVNVKDTDYTYRYNGTTWVAISANAIPKATDTVDGLLSKEDHAKYEDANSKKHTHSNKSVLDGITSALVNNWNAAKTHADSAHAPSNAEVNQNAFSQFTVGTTSIIATNKTDVLTLVAGDNITLTPDISNKRITIVSKNTIYTHPTYTERSSGLYKITVDGTGHVSGATAVTKSDITALGIPSSDTDTHYTTGLKVGASSTATANAAATNGNVYLNVLDNSTVRDSHKIIGSGATTVTSDANGVITISSTTYSAGNGISLSGTTFSNSGVRSISTGTSNGTISVNTNGTTANVAVYGLGSAAYTASSAYAAANHTHNYAGSPSPGGSATSAVKLDSSAGSATQPVYFSDGKPVSCTYTLGKSVPSDAVFTDTKVTSVHKNPSPPAPLITGYLTWVTGATTDSVFINNGIRYATLEGTDSTNGYGIFILGNNTSSGNKGNKYGAIRLYGTGEYFGQIAQMDGTSNVNHSLPATSGTILNTGTTSFTPSLTSGTAIGTLKINNTSTTLYAPTNTDTKVNVTLDTTTKAYLLGTSTTPTSSATGVTAIADTGVYLDTTSGMLTATTFKGALSGNASSSTYSSNIRVTETNPTTAKWYYPVWIDDKKLNTNYVLRANDGFCMNSSEGTASAVGKTYLRLGNSVASGTAGNKRGYIRIHNESSGYTELVTPKSSTNYQISFPSLSGTLALQTECVQGVMGNNPVTLSYIMGSKYVVLIGTSSGMNYSGAVCHAISSNMTAVSSTSLVNIGADSLKYSISTSGDITITPAGSGSHGSKYVAIYFK